MRRDAEARGVRSRCGGLRRTLTALLLLAGCRVLAGRPPDEAAVARLGADLGRDYPSVSALSLGDSPGLGVLLRPGPSIVALPDGWRIEGLCRRTVGATPEVCAEPFDVEITRRGDRALVVVRVYEMKISCRFIPHTIWYMSQSVCEARPTGDVRSDRRLAREIAERL
jgi:hypothetical protein